MSGPALSIENLSVSYRGNGWRARHHRVVHDVSFTIEEGQTLALVGESGSGKSTIGNAVLGLVPVEAGSVRLAGEDITRARPSRRRALATQLQAVFQNPYGSLNPARTIGSALAEPLRASGVSAADAKQRVAELLVRVNLPADAASRRPAAFSGGQRQRIAIARAVAMRPRVIVCDEPTSALDVSTQASVLALLRELQAELDVSLLFITHDLAVVRDFADRACVLQAGRLVEAGTSREICDHPTHPYTQRLIASAPVPDPVVQRVRRAQWRAMTAEAGG